MTKSIFFDRDNTLILSDGYLGDPAGVKLIAGAAAAIARARSLGFSIITISNQSGVARGMFSEEDVAAVNARMEELLRGENPEAIIDRHEFCPYHPQALLEKYRQESELRKPKPGMIRRAAQAMDVDLPSSWVIGDAPRDIQAGHAAGCHTILLSDPSIPPSPAAGEKSNIDPDETVSSLAEAMDVIEAVVSASAASTTTEQTLADLDNSRRRLRLGGNPENQRPDDTGVSLNKNFIPAAPLHPEIPPMPEPGRPLEAARAAPPASTGGVESFAEEIPGDRRGRRHPGKPDFSITKLLAGITQSLALAVAVGVYFYRADPVPPLLAAIFIQLLTISLLLMGKDL